jgi:hypothetical protein
MLKIARLIWELECKYTTWVDYQVDRVHYLVKREWAPETVRTELNGRSCCLAHSCWRCCLQGGRSLQMGKPKHFWADFLALLKEEGLDCQAFLAEWRSRIDADSDECIAHDSHWILDWIAMQIDVA